MNDITENILLNSDEFENEKQYWMDKLSADISELPLPYDNIRTEDSLKSEYKEVLDNRISETLIRICNSQDLSLYVLTLTALKILLYKYSGQTDIIVASPVYAKNKEDLRYNNFVFLRDFFFVEMTFKEALENVKQTVVYGYKNQNYPMDKIIEKLGYSHNKASLFKVAFLMENIHLRESIEEIIHSNDNDIAFTIIRKEDSLELCIIYDKTVFMRETIVQMLECYTKILNDMLRNKEGRLADLELVTESEKYRILYELNSTVANYPKDKTIHRLFMEQARKTPDNIAVVFGEKQLTYRELDAKSSMLAVYLNSEHSVKPESLVGVFMDKSESLIVAVMGILKAGGAYIPIDPQYPTERIRTIIDDANLEVIVSSKKHIDVLNRLQWECKSFNAYVCIDSEDVYYEEEVKKNELMNKDVWEYVGINAADDIAAGAWVSSYTGENLSGEEMDEYSENILKKLMPHLHKDMRVLEIGCASGLSMYRIAPHVGMYYGTDLSEVIIERNKERINAEGIKNIKLSCVHAHEIDSIEEREFDIVIMNSVVQCFHGHNYLRKVVSKAINLLKDKGIIFIGDVMDLEQKHVLVNSLREFKQNNSGSNFRTKLDWTVELFLSRSFFEDLKIEIKEIEQVCFSDKIYSIENELTKFRYDTVININKDNHFKSQNKKHKIQHGIGDINKYVSNEYNLPVNTAPHNAAYVIYTSGTTGIPKGVVIEHRNLVRLMFNDKMQFDFNEKDVWTMFHSFSFDFSVWEMYGALLYGGKLVVIPKFLAMDTKEYLKLLKREGVTVLNQTPGAFYNLSNEEMNFKEKELKLRYVIFGGEALKPLMLKDWRNKYPKTKLINMYGITETTVHVTYKEITENEIGLNISNIGKPIPTLTAYVMDRNLRLLPAGVPGELCVGGEGVARGYLNRKGLTQEKFVPSPYNHSERIYKSGDLVKLLANGDMEYLGRIDQQVKIRGHRIELGEIEAAILKNELVKEAVVAVKEDKNGDKYICAYYVSREELTISEFKEYLSRKLPYYSIPSYFIQVDKMPLTNNGKVDKRALIDPFKNLNTGTKYEAPSNDIEIRLAEEWKSLLNIERVGINDNFFELGGHSLKATIFASKAHRLFNVEIPLTEIFKTPTIKGIARYIAEAEESVYKTIKPIEEKEYYPLSSAQKRLYILSRLDENGISYNMAGVMMVKGKPDRGRIEDAFKRLIERHEVLRTSFVIIDMEPMQKIHKNVEFRLDFIESAEESIKDVVQNFVKPFDLGIPPLIRAGLVKISEDKHLFMFDMHHIASDGISMATIIKEFSNIYNGKKLPELKIQYKDFAAWQNDLFKSNLLKKQEEYWINRFSGELPVLNMPLDFTRPVLQSFTGDTVSFELDNELSKSIYNLCGETGTTVYMLLLAAYNCLLQKYTGQEDIIVGSPIAGRQNPDLYNVVGMFVNTLAMRNYPAGGKGFIEFLAEVKENSLKAYENQDYQFEELVDKLDVKRDVSRNPLFDTMFVVENMDYAKVDIDNLDFSAVDIRTKVSRFDLVLYTFERDGHFLFELEYGTKLFRKETAERILGHYVNILKDIVNNPHKKLYEIEMLSEHERKHIMFDLNNTKAAFPEEITIHRLFEEQVEKKPDNIAVIFEGHKMTYKELNSRSNQLARSIRKKGVTRDCIVGIMVERSFEMPVGILGILKAGGAYLPIDPGYPSDRIRFMLEDSRTALLLTQQKYLDKIPEGFDGLEVLTIDSEEIYTGDTSNIGETSSSKNLAYVIYTSGSTGKPKGVMIEHRSLVNRLNWMQKKYPIEQGDVILQKTTYTFDVSVWELLWWAIQGSQVCFLRPGGEKDPQIIVETIENNKVTVIYFVSSMLNAFLEYMSERTDRHKLRSLRRVFAGGEALSASQVNRFNKLLGRAFHTKLIDLYGPTEATIDVSYYDCPTEEDVEIVPIGKPLDNTELFVLDRFNRLQPIGVPGELHIAGAGLARGYLNRPELTAEKFTANPFRSGERMYRTGDLVRWLPDGNMEYLGRIDHQVKIRGYRIELGEIESCLLRNKHIKEAAVTAREDKEGDKYLCAYIVGSNELTTSELKRYLSDELPEYMVPSCFVHMEKMPLTPNGKLNRKALPEPDNRKRFGVEYVMPVNETERELVKIWQEVLDIDRVGITDNFFEIGGNSLKATILIARMNKRFNVEVPLSEIFRMPEIRKLANYISDIERNTYRPIEPLEERKYYPASAAQKRIFTGSIADSGGIVYNTTGCVSIEGKLDMERLEECLNRLLQRHESLRTSFEIIDGELVQKIHKNIKIRPLYLEAEQHVLDETVRNFIKPFNLENAPLVRVGLIRLQENKYVFICDMHHIISDGVSISILISELTKLYNGEELRELRLQYKDFAVWQNKLLDSEKIKRQEEYWLDMFSGDMPARIMPTDFARVNKKSFRGKSIVFEIDEETTEKLKKLVSETETTLYMTLLAIYNIVVSKYAGHNDMIIGSPVAGRTHADLENVIGVFINMLAMRNNPSGEKIFRNFLGEVKQNTLKAFENQDYQFDVLVEKLNLGSSINQNPLFNIIFVFQNMEIKETVIEDLKFKPYELDVNTSMYDLILNAREENRIINMVLTFSTELFAESTIVLFSKHMVKVIKAVTENPDIMLKDIDLLDEKERTGNLDSIKEIRKDVNIDFNF